MEKFQWHGMQIPVVAEVDVLVAGGGTSGFIAAVAAAQTGAATLLIEKLGYLGSCTTTPYNTSIGIFNDTDNHRIIDGLAGEFLRRMAAQGDCVNIDSKSPQIWPPATKQIAIEMVHDANVRVLLHTTMIDAVASAGIVAGVVIHNKAGLGFVKAKAFVDATGDADLATYAGAPYEIEDTETIQQVSCDLFASGVDSDRVVQWARENSEKIVGAYGLKENKADGTQEMLGFTIPQLGMNAEGEMVHIGVMPTVKLCIHRDVVRLQGNSDIDPLDPEALSSAEMDGYLRALEHLKYMQDNVPGFENTYVVSTNFLGVRESRRIIGNHILTIDEVTNQARFDDVVALNCRGLDYHLRGTVFKISFFEGHHDIPLAALVPKGFTNLLVSGRCISSDHLAQASTRGAATCMATGHAAGVAAAVTATAGGIDKVNVKDIQDILLCQKAILKV